MSRSSNLDSFRDGRLVAVYLLLCRVLAPGPVQYYSQHFCLVAVKLFLQTQISSTEPRERALSGATIPGQNGPGSEDMALYSPKLQRHEPQHQIA